MARKKKELTFEEKQQEKINRTLKGLKEDYLYIPDPTYKYNIGDRLIIIMEILLPQHIVKMCGCGLV